MSDANQATIKGFKANDAEESVGHQSGTHIIKLLELKHDEFTDEDINFAYKVVGYVHRHLAQKPQVISQKPIGAIA